MPFHTRAPPTPDRFRPGVFRRTGDIIFLSSRPRAAAVGGQPFWGRSGRITPARTDDPHGTGEAPSLPGAHGDIARGWQPVPLPSGREGGGAGDIEEMRIADERVRARPAVDVKPLRGQPLTSVARHLRVRPSAAEKRRPIDEFNSVRPRVTPLFPRDPRPTVIQSLTLTGAADGGGWGWGCASGEEDPDQREQPFDLRFSRVAGPTG